MSDVPMMPAGTRALSAERRFYGGMALAMLAMVLAGFAPSFYLRGLVPAYSPYLPMTPVVLAHGLLFTAWLLLFVLQVALISGRRPDLHRRLGLVGFGLLLALLLTGLLAALYSVVRASGPPVIPPLSWLAVPLLDIPVFVGLIGAALYYRHSPQTHKRLMLAAMIDMSTAGVARLPIFPAHLPMPFIIIGTLALLLGALAVWDLRSRRAIHPATIIASITVIGSWIFRFAIWETAPWLGFARWAVSFVE